MQVFYQFRVRFYYFHVGLTFSLLESCRRHPMEWRITSKGNFATQTQGGWNNWGTNWKHGGKCCEDLYFRKYISLVRLRTIFHSFISNFKHHLAKRPEELELDDLDELEDELDEKVFLEYRDKRIAEMKASLKASKFGEVLEITGKDYIQEVNKAGDGIWVILHLYKQGYKGIKYMKF